MVRLTDARSRALDKLLVQYLELEPADRKSFMERCERRYPRLSSWLEKLAAQTATVSVFQNGVDQLAIEAVDAVRPEQTRLEPGHRIGPWEITDCIGEGGMGRVYQARRADGAFDMSVAIKLLKLRGSGLGEQLRRETRLLARLEHASITRLLDAGLDEAGGPFVVMEWVEGRDLSEWRDAGPDINAILDATTQIADALTHAHQRLIVHGDIKPGNVRIRNDGQLKLLDFGVARLLAEGDEQNAWLAAMTPAFAAPEQRRGEAPTTRSDVWSLGALMAWMLGATPPRSSSELSSLTRRIEARTGRARELVAIIERACADDPEARYDTVAGLVTDLRRYRRHQPIDAMPQSRSYRLGKFVRRNRLLAGTAGAFVLTLIAGLAATTGMYLQAEREAARAVAANERTESVKSFLVNTLAEADHYVNPGEMPTVRDVLDRGREEIVHEFSDQPDIAAEVLQVIGNSYVGLGELPLARETLEQAMALIEAGTVPALPMQTVAEIRFLLAHSVGQSDPERGREIARGTLEKIESVPGLEKVRADLLGQLAHSNLMSGNIEQGLALREESRDIACQAALELDETCMAALGDLKYFYSHAGYPEKSLQSAREAYRMARDIHAQRDHPRIIASGMAYGEALANNGQPEAAAELLESLVEMAQTVYGDDHVQAGAVGYVLARAYWRAGLTHKAWEVHDRSLERVARHFPESVGIAVQRNFLPLKLFDLHRLDEAERALERHDYIPIEKIPDHALAGRQQNQLILDALRNPGSHEIRERLRELAQEMTERDPGVSARLRLTGLRHAIDAGELSAARDWLKFTQELDANRLSEARLTMSQARIALLENDPARALEHARAGEQSLLADGETSGPRLARARSIQAEALCQQDRIEKGREQLQKATHYWSETARVEAGEQVVLEIAASCREAEPSPDPVEET